ncbi:hypothetical protein OKA05_24490 [Luteolibacter arcticus]|uniref:Uncharacterized protein n=1 Tax=Luteolibacter arcticus TaxID=1581411 RepID=A0ABT3GQE3_9BACT|nr:hypothetical protein [Luteolibacter arcticus]MCW1925739.1 hypothetical protein [Luteolibacter arcticus]
MNESAPNAVEEDVALIESCWSQLAPGECCELEGKQIEFSLISPEKYLEGRGTLETVPHPTQPGLCRLRIEVPVPGSSEPCEVFLPPAAVAMITEVRWSTDRFILKMGDDGGR